MRPEVLITLYGRCSTEVSYPDLAETSDASPVGDTVEQNTTVGDTTTPERGTTERIPTQPASDVLRTPTQAHRSAEERRSDGKARRRDVPLDSHAELAAATGRADPLALLREQDAFRLPELVPIRYGRMLQTPFTFFRGAARVMAADLAGTPASGLRAQVCGDAHISNFGVFASPERRLVFDINDFDETLPGPWEWDVKRLAASLAVAARGNGLSGKQRRKILLAAVAQYRTAMAQFAALTNLEVWYARADVEDLRARLASYLDRSRLKSLDKAFDKARTRNSMQAMAKLSTVVDGSRRFVADPPLVVPIAELAPGTDEADVRERLSTLIRQYGHTMQSDRRVVLHQYDFADLARKVVGVGSVGTRCWIVLMTGRDDSDGLILQVKEAGRSVLEEYVGKSEYSNHGQRVVAGQRLMQQSSDIFLGWQRAEGFDGESRDFYVRQLRDWKLSVPVEALLPDGLLLYGGVCAWSLARAHARSGDRIAIAGYLGKRDVFDDAIAEFAERYADLNVSDHNLLRDAVTSGRLTAETGV